MAGAGLLNIELESNSVTVLQLTCTDCNGNPINLTGYTFKMSLADTAPPNTTYYTLYSSGYYGATNSDITLTDATTGQLQIDLTNAQAALVTATVTDSVYDTLFKPASDPAIPMLKGHCSIIAGITEP